MKSKFFPILTAVCILGLTSCGKTPEPTPEPHVHNVSLEWSKDEHHHWKACNGCSEEFEPAAHVLGERTNYVDPTPEQDGGFDEICETCGYVLHTTIPYFILTVEMEVPKAGEVINPVPTSYSWNHPSDIFLEPQFMWYHNHFLANSWKDETVIAPEKYRGDTIKACVYIILAEDTKNQVLYHDETHEGLENFKVIINGGEAENTYSTMAFLTGDTGYCFQREYILE